MSREAVNEVHDRFTENSDVTIRADPDRAFVDFERSHTECVALLSRDLEEIEAAMPFHPQLLVPLRRLIS